MFSFSFALPHAFSAPFVYYTTKLSMFAPGAPWHISFPQIRRDFAFKEKMFWKLWGELNRLLAFSNWPIHFQSTYGGSMRWSLPAS